MYLLCRLDRKKICFLYVEWRERMVCIDNYRVFFFFFTVFIPQICDIH